MNHKTGVYTPDISDRIKHFLFGKHDYVMATVLDHHNNFVDENGFGWDKCSICGHYKGVFLGEQNRKILNNLPTVSESEFNALEDGGTLNEDNVKDFLEK